MTKVGLTGQCCFFGVFSLTGQLVNNGNLSVDVFSKLSYYTDSTVSVKIVEERLKFFNLSNLRLFAVSLSFHGADLQAGWGGDVAGTGFEISLTIESVY